MVESTQADPAGVDALLALAQDAQAFKSVLADARAALSDRNVPWYPYGSLDNFHLLERMLEGEFRNMFNDVRGQVIADIGAADGDTAFFLESRGHAVDVIDYAPTNFNGCRGVRALREQLGSSIGIHEVDLDAQFELPRESYGLTLLLGILYHLKNPYYALEVMARRSRWMLLSTRIARWSSSAEGSEASRIELSRAPVAYLLAPDETNGDATNYWIFSEPGLRRLLDRTGWNVCCFRSFGATDASDPASPQGDERAFCLLRSRYL